MIKRIGLVKFVDLLTNSTQLKFYRKQFKTKNFKGVLSLLAGNTIAKLILTLGGLILADFYGPANYGIYKVFLSYVMILPVLSSLRLDSIMILQKGSKEVRNLFTGTIYVTLILTTLFIIILFLWKWLGVTKIDLSYGILGLCGLGGFVTACNNSQNAMFTKFKLFKQLANFFIISSFFSVLAQAFFYVLDWTEFGLIYGWIIGLLVGFIYNFRISKDRLVNFDLGMFRAAVRENFKVVKYTYPSDSINALANNIMPILAISYFADKEVGLYGMAFTILSTPLMLISSSVSRVYFQKSFLLNEHDKKGLTQLTYRVIFSSTGLMLLFVLLMNSIGIYLLEFLLGDRWAGLDAYIMLLSIWIVSRIGLNCISPVIIIIKKNQYSLWFNIYLLLVNLLSIYLGVVYDDFVFCIGIFSILSSIGYLSLLGIVVYNLKKNERYGN